MTGHSLGGALAMLCACDIQEWLSAKNADAGKHSSPENATIDGRIGVITFGAPRVGVRLSVPRQSDNHDRNTIVLLTVFLH